MASHGWFPFGGRREPHVVALDLKLNIGATGAILSTSRYRGVSAVTRNAAGDYTLTLSEAYPSGSFAGMAATYNVNSTTPTDFTFQVYSVDELAKTIKFKALTGVTATELASGATLYLEPKFRNTGG